MARFIKLCDVCGIHGADGACNTQTHYGGLQVTRLNREELNKAMAKRGIQRAKERYYVTADYSRAVEAGDPEAARLLVGKGGEVSEATLERYPNIETEEGFSVAVVSRDPEDERNAMITEGASETTIENYERMVAHREAQESLRPQAAATTAVSRQNAMVAEANVVEKMGLSERDSLTSTDAYAPVSEGGAGGVTVPPPDTKSGREADTSSSKNTGTASNTRTKTVSKTANKKDKDADK